MTTETYHFRPIKRQARRKVVCPGCGKKRTIQRTFSQTVNPYHPAIRALPPDHSYDDAWHAVLDSVRDEVRAWVPSDYESRHNACVEQP